MGHYKYVNGVCYLLMPELKKAFLAQQHIQIEPLVNMVIPSHVEDLEVTAVDNNAFRNDSKLQTVTLPNTITTICFDAFKGCKNLTSVKFYNTKDSNNKCIQIDSSAFEDCVNLEEVLCVDEPYEFTVADSAFTNCYKLSHFNGSIKTAEFEAFSNCFSLDVLLFAHEAFWRTNTFIGCKSLNTVQFLGDVKTFLPSTCLKQLKKKSVKCSANSNIANLVYDGYKIEVFERG